MGVTGVTRAAHDPLSVQISRIVASDILRGSESLCRLLRYLADQSVDHPGTSVKEYQIATEVFGRPSDFDPRLDSTVRVQTSRLRSKLSEYYAGAGIADKTIVEIPKGSYALAVHDRPVVAEPESHLEPVETHRDPALQGRTASNAVWALSLLCGGLVIALIYLALVKPKESGPAAAAIPEAQRIFWSGFLDRTQEPLVVFSNAEFVGRPETGMRYFDPSKDSRTQILDHYTGVGEVLAIHELDRLFTQFQRAIRVKRGRLLSMDDAKGNDLIFIGSPSENLSLRELPTTQEFVFRIAADGPRKGDLAIVNLNPRAGEAPRYFGSNANPVVDDYSLIGLVPGITSANWVMILAGTTTIGTQAAVEFVCRASNTEELVRRVGMSPSGMLAPFELVIHSKVSRGVPVSSEIVAVHRRSD